MTHDIATRCVYPHGRVVGAGWIRDENETIARVQSSENGRALSEHRSVDRGVELARSGKDFGHTSSNVRWVTGGGQRARDGKNSKCPPIGPCDEASVTVSAAVSSDC